MRMSPLLAYRVSGGVMGFSPPVREKGYRGRADKRSAIRDLWPVRRQRNRWRAAQDDRKSAGLGALRPSRRPLRGLLRMTEVCNATHNTSSSRGVPGGRVSEDARSTCSQAFFRSCPTASLVRPVWLARLPRRELADGVEDGVPIVDLAVLRMHHDVLHPSLGIGGDALLHHADIAAIPVRADRDRETGVGPVAAQPGDDRFRLFGGDLAAVPAIADLDGATV